MSSTAHSASRVTRRTGTLATSMAAAFGPSPRFLVPSLVWYGLSPRLNGVGRAGRASELAPGGWAA